MFEHLDFLGSFFLLDPLLHALVQFVCDLNQFTTLQEPLKRQIGEHGHLFLLKVSMAKGAIGIRQDCASAFQTASGAATCQNKWILNDVIAGIGSSAA